MEDNIAHILEHGRRQKRLHYWLAQFSHEGCPTESAQVLAIREKLETYRLLLARKLKAATAQDSGETEGRISSLERELETDFEDRRLTPSAIGEANLSLDPKV